MFGAMSLFRQPLEMGERVHQEVQQLHTLNLLNDVKQDFKVGGSLGSTCGSVCRCSVS